MLIFHFILSLFLLFQPIITDSPKGKLFIIGGGKRSKAMLDRMIREADLKEKDYIIILPMASSEPDSAIFYAVTQFREVGLQNVFGFNFTKNENPSRQKLDSLKNAKLIYISGGDQNRFMQIVSGTSTEQTIKSAYQNGAMIAGTSAGAAVMSKKMITGNSLKIKNSDEGFRTIEAENVELGQGLALIENAIIDQHFIWRSRYNRLISVALENPQEICIGIDEATAILVKNNQAEVVGDSQVIVLRNTAQKLSKSGNLLSGKTLQLDVLLAGDMIQLGK